MTDYLYLDIETLPTTNPETIAEIADGVTPPATMSKPETIAEWEKTKKPDLVKEAVAKTSFSGAFGSICTIGWAWNNERPSTFDMRPDLDWSEGEMLSALSELLRVKERQSYSTPVIVGHYVADFDLRFIWQRAFVNGVLMPAWWPRDPKPWSKEVHDTMQMWAGAKGSISLDNLCKALGIQGKTGVDGSMVAGMWERGEYDAVAEYCRDDVERVRRAHQKMLVAYGERE